MYVRASLLSLMYCLALCAEPAKETNQTYFLLEHLRASMCSMGEPLISNIDGVSVQGGADMAKFFPAAGEVGASAKVAYKQTLFRSAGHGGALKTSGSLQVSAGLSGAGGGSMLDGEVGLLYGCQGDEKRKGGYSVSVGFGGISMSFGIDAQEFFDRSYDNSRPAPVNGTQIIQSFLDANNDVRELLNERGGLNKVEMDDGFPLRVTDFPKNKISDLLPHSDTGERTYAEVLDESIKTQRAFRDTQRYWGELTPAKLIERMHAPLDPTDPSAREKRADLIPLISLEYEKMKQDLEAFDRQLSEQLMWLDGTGNFHPEERAKLKERIGFTTRTAPHREVPDFIVGDQNIKVHLPGFQAKAREIFGPGGKFQALCEGAHFVNGLYARRASQTQEQAGAEGNVLAYDCVAGELVDSTEYLKRRGRNRSISSWLERLKAQKSALRDMRLYFGDSYGEFLKGNIGENRNLQIGGIRRTRKSIFTGCNSANISSSGLKNLQSMPALLQQLLQAMRDGTITDISSLEAVLKSVTGNGLLKTLNPKATLSYSYSEPTGLSKGQLSLGEDSTVFSPEVRDVIVNPCPKVVGQGDPNGETLLVRH